jgi:hypothetical protein
MVLPLAIVTIACLGCKTFCAVATVIFYEPSKAEAEALSKQGKVRHIVTNLLLLLPSVAVGVALFLCLPVAAAVPLLVVPSEWFSERAVNAIYLLRRSVAA